MARPELTKYIELKEQGSSATDISVIAREDGLSIVEAIYVIHNLFDLPMVK